MGEGPRGRKKQNVLTATAHSWTIQGGQPQQGTVVQTGGLQPLVGHEIKLVRTSMF